VDVLFLASADELRTWVASRTVDEVWLGFHRVRSGFSPPSSLTVSGAAEVLADAGLVEVGRGPVDANRYAVRFAPGKVVRRRSAPEEPGLPSGVMPVLAEAYEEEFRLHAEAWAYFQEQSPKYRRTAIWWVTSGKSEETRRRRLAALVESSAAGERVAQLQRQM
jgi:hypothetical protein